MRHNPRQPSQVAGDNPAGRTRNRVRQNRNQNPDVFQMNSQLQAQRPETSSEIGLPVSVAIPIPVQTQAPCAGAFAELSDRSPRRNLAVPTTTTPQASSSVLFIPVGASERNSTRGGGRADERDVAGYTNRENSPAGSG